MNEIVKLFLIRSEGEKCAVEKQINKFLEENKSYYVHDIKVSHNDFSVFMVVVFRLIIIEDKNVHLFREEKIRK